jgi:hypothetical protein
MRFLGFELNRQTKEVDEAIEAFSGKGEERPAKQRYDEKGEGWENLQQIPGIGHVGLGSFNMFYQTYVNRMYENEYSKIMSYREMAEFPEIADVIEDATNESTQVDHNDKLLNLEILDAELSSNENIVKNITKEFQNLFYQQLDNFTDTMWDMFRSYYIDGRIFYERVINEKKPAEGIKRKRKQERMLFCLTPSRLGL